MARDKEETKARILAAVGKLLAESGFEQLGVNAIAREAGVDKVLIYRYFENLPSLLQTFGKEGNYWITVAELIADETVFDDKSLADAMVLLLTRFLYDLQERPITQEIIRWELLEGNELTHELATVRDQVAIESLKFLKQKYSFPPDQDIPAISAVLIAGIVYLVLRSKVNDTFLGIDFSSPSGWQRIEGAIASLLGGIGKNDA
ncbi:TetR/AcrR family transcriptional regulator [Anabaena cylindrica FACHB-243]|uniref:Regulatory protein TetR n=1 Tax=Anabaena cylindrica (strain ATCC 27899 / PCC 7122) TaxID=272123 RepID=K9ZF56_ANACC|nr:MULTISPECIES: TetR/AcrR family transcriptional regulator [Anabaena]AFZ57379.1 regulatory protein TetR [Anabaena cylindrica PCC 7122]MBD2421061.1 TetR/AcrR family transcriptional regulator [Anabaena cylindrica FACHB-243]MBY5284965.1 TetR/AcrR family transcriptional regulator [Anabaena sp. CCAP 1446/1C]MBY5306369.1 TetR/AcrR family transcriptional regulator [Anabaena sp. CCAP 1446/1C]MCM2405814.1 TetR/AcrR family transcriptional regulator [Anabaena sp. CCAP 1446/1C]